MNRCTHAAWMVAAMVAATSHHASADDTKAPTVPTRARLHHIPPTQAVAGTDIELVAIIDDAWIEDSLQARYRTGAAGTWHSAPFERSTAGGYYATLPAVAAREPGIDYFIVGGRDQLHFASADEPHRIRIDMDSESRWRAAELQRLRGRRYQLASHFEVVDFGRDLGDDRYIRGEVDWTYRLVGRLYSVTLGYGFIDGETPSPATPEDPQAQRGARFGYGEVRVRLRPSLWLDGRTVMGVGQEGFMTGIGGQLVFGDDWRTCVKVGGEALSELSYQAFVTLQWDTVPPFLMSATAATSNQPAALIDSGSYVRYEISYPIRERFRVAGHGTFAARGNRPGWFGGGMSTHLDF